MHLVRAVAGLGSDELLQLTLVCQERQAWTACTLW